MALPDPRANNPLNIQYNHPDVPPSDYFWTKWRSSDQIKAVMNKKLTRGMRNNNPLNIEKGNSWQGERNTQSDRRFEEFISLEYGLRAGFLILKKYLARPPKGYGLETLTQIINRWAPRSENNTSSYVEFVSARSQVSKTERLKWTDKNKLCRIVQAMCIIESNADISFGRIENAYALANQ